MQAITLNGVPFTLGMTLVGWSGREIETSEDEFEITNWNDEHGSCPCINRKNSYIYTAVANYFSSQQARINYQVQLLENIKRSIDKDIEFLKEDGLPEYCRSLKGLK
jgi:hypothetical protein